MTAESIVELPGGWWHGDACHRDVALRGLNGEDEYWLADYATALPPAQVVTALLARCVQRIGPVHSVTSADVRSLTAGDREALLLHLRRLTFGDAIPAVLKCPACAGRMDLDLAAGQFLVSRYRDAAPAYHMTIPVAGTERSVVFRLPSGADQEDAIEFPDPRQGARRILSRCLLEMDPPLAVEDWPDEDIERIGERMAGLDPQAELKLTLKCPNCDSPLETIFDSAAYFFSEVALRRRNLLREVHLLAFYYHWTESEILALARERRQAFLALIAEELEARVR